MIILQVVVAVTLSEELQLEEQPVPPALATTTAGQMSFGKERAQKKHYWRQRVLAQGRDILGVFLVVMHNDTENHWVPINGKC